MSNKSTCLIDDCTAPVAHRGWCSKHYQRWKRNGDPLATRTAPTGEPVAWIRRAIMVDTDDCQEFPFGRSEKGYGRVRFEGSDRSAPHVALLLSGQAQPPAPGNRALHSCDNPPCVNLKHLRWGSQSENITEMWARDRRVRRLGRAS